MIYLPVGTGVNKFAFKANKTANKAKNFFIIM